MLQLLRHLRSYHPHKVLPLRLLPQVRRLLPVVRKRVQAQPVEVEVAEAEAEEAEVVEEGVDEAETAVATLKLAEAETAEAMPDSPEVAVAAMGPEPVVELEGEVAARVGHSVRFCGSRGICPETSNPYQCEPA
jgi:hypothetical protein